jgi:hypothetical protein
MANRAQTVGKTASSGFLAYFVKTFVIISSKVCLQLWSAAPKYVPGCRQGASLFEEGVLMVNGRSAPKLFEKFNKV